MVSLAILSAQLEVKIAWAQDWNSEHVAVRFLDRHAWVGAFNPEGRPSTPEALAVHGLSDERLAGCVPFAERAHELADILTEADFDGFQPVIVAHNAPFDVGFLDLEFERAGRSVSWGPIVDTRLISKILWPGEKGSLDALCERLGVDRGDRDERHESLKDARLLALCLPGLTSEIARRLA